LGNPIATTGTSTDSDYTRYPKQDIIDKLIEAQVDFTRKTNCLNTFAIVECTADQAEYRQPNNCLLITDAKYFTADNSYEQIRFKQNKQQMKRVSSEWQQDASGTPEWIYPSYTHGNTRTFGLYPRPSSDGTTYDGTGLGTVTSATSFTFTGDIAGANIAGAPLALTDSQGRDFTTLGVAVGMMLFNVTDGSSAQITGIVNGAATNDRLEGTLAGGTLNLWIDGDSFVVTTGQYGVVIRATGDEEYVFSSDYGALTDITPLSGNVLLDYIRRPIKLDHDTQFPEIPMDYHQALAEYAIWKLGMTEYNGNVMLERAGQAKEQWFEYIQDYKDHGYSEIETNNQIEDREYLEFGWGYYTNNRY
jgi:hypothetical protein